LAKNIPIRKTAHFKNFKPPENRFIQEAFYATYISKMKREAPKNGFIG